MTVMTHTGSSPQSPRWADLHRSYWNSISGSYDGLYTTPWSRRENAVVQAVIEDAPIPVGGRVLDLGCGTGLGRQLLRHALPDATYLGVDLSERMLEQARRSDPSSTYISASFDSGLDFIDTHSVDAVLVLFSTVSFSCSPLDLLHSIRRVLKPGGWGYVSGLSTHAVSRWLRGGRRDDYRTRGDGSGASVPARYMTSRGLRTLAETAGLVDIDVTGMNIFSGCVERTSLWPIGRRAAQTWPDLSHLIEVTFRTPGAEPEGEHR